MPGGEAECCRAVPPDAPGRLEAARRRLTASLVELRDAGDTVAGEWWQRALPEERLLAAEQAGHRTLAATAQRQGLIVSLPISIGAA